MKKILSVALAALFALAPAVSVASPRAEVDILSGTSILRCASTTYGKKKVVLVCAAGTLKHKANGSAYATTEFGPYEFHPYATFVDAPVGNGAGAVGAGDSTVTVTGGYNVALNLANANTWSGAQTFSAGTVNSAVPSSACVTGGPIAASCIGSPTSAVALAVGHVTGSFGSTASADSGQIQWYYGTGSSEQHCGLYIAQVSGSLVETGSRACGFAVNGTLQLQSNQITGITRLQQAAAGDIYGSCAMSASTTCVVTWSYAPTYCVATVAGSTPIADAIAISGTSVTVTAASSNSATWNVHCL